METEIQVGYYHELTYQWKDDVIIRLKGNKKTIDLIRKMLEESDPHKDIQDKMWPYEWTVK